MKFALKTSVIISVVAASSLVVALSASELSAQIKQVRKGARLKIDGTLPTQRDVNADTDGDGRTNFLISRAAGSTYLKEGTDPLVKINRGQYSVRERLAADRSTPQLVDSAMAPGIQWWGSETNPTHRVFQLGDSAQDFVIIQDFDGDGKDDPAIWRPGNPGKFIIYLATTNTFREESFGLAGDDPTVTGDYDGDGKADPATFRCPATTPGQCYFFYRGSLNNPSGGITFVPWGFGVDGDFYANPGDFDGDGKYDFCLQRTAPGTSSNGQFVLLKSSNFGVEYINWGNDTDFVIPGDYDGDGKSDFCVRKTLNSIHYYWILTRTGQASVIPWGKSGDESVPGDYDGDGLQDIAIWREDSANAGNNYFWVRKSSDGSHLAFEWGMGFDYPVANWFVH